MFAFGEKKNSEGFRLGAVKSGNPGLGVKQYVSHHIKPFNTFFERYVFVLIYVNTVEKFGFSLPHQYPHDGCLVLKALTRTGKGGDRIIQTEVVFTSLDEDDN